MKRPCVFFDRDGVVNVSPGAGYVTRWKDFRFEEGIVECLRIVRDRGYAAVLVTSQRCVGKGLISKEGLESVHDRMQEVLEAEGVRFLDIFAFTGLPETEAWEKPSPEMILLATAKHDLDLSSSWMIGDQDRDIEMGRRAGVGTTVRVRGDRPATVQADHTVFSVQEVADLLRKDLNPTNCGGYDS